MAEPIQPRRRTVSLLLATALATGATGASATGADADPAQRVVVLRERAAASFLDNTYTLQVVKMRGYSVDVRVNGERQTLKRGQTIAPPDSDCTLTFQKISPETRIARFVTDCDE